MTSDAFDTYGKALPPSAEALAEADKDAFILGYVHGSMQDGRPYYAYVAIPPSKYQEFHAITSARKDMIIGDYGTVVAAGFEPEPPPEVIKKMRDVYGFDDQYEEKLRQDALRQQKMFFDNQEKKRIDDIVAFLQKTPNGKTLI